MLLLLVLVSRPLVVVPALLPIVVVLAAMLTLFFEGGVPSRPLLGALGVSFLRVLLAVYMLLQEADGVGSSFVEVVVVAWLPSLRTRRAAGDCGMVMTVACERVLRFEEDVFCISPPFLLTSASDPVRVML